MVRTRKAIGLTTTWYLQFEDAVDVLKVMHPTFDFVFLFDHSSGHSKERPDGLNQHRMNRSFGGKAVPRMRSTEIIQEEGFLGPLDRTVEPGDTQSLVFSPSDTGPFWMTDAERERNLDSTSTLVTHVL